MYNPNRSAKKRKHRDRGPRRREPESDQGWNYNNGPSASSDAEGGELHDPLRALHIEAHEAKILRGPQAEAAADSLEVLVCYEVTETGEGSGTTPIRQIKSRMKDSQEMTRTGAAGVLVKLRSGDESQQSTSHLGTGGQRHEQDGPKLSIIDMDADVDTYTNGTGSTPSGRPLAQSIWVDRYDIRLLLDSLPSIPLDPHSISTSTIRASSPSGWSDLSSDAEDTFFFTTEETEDFRRDKRRRLIEQAREERLKQRLEEDGDDAENDDTHDAWGGSDEEPDETQALLMARTATHLASSPNPAQLEMRILANHGADARFAFLLPKGRWSRAWVTAKDKVKIEKEKEAKEKEKQATLGGLAGYGSGSDDSASDVEKNEDEANGLSNESEVPQPPAVPPPLPPSPPSAPPPPLAPMTDGDMDAESAIKAARRQRAKEWAEKRRAMASDSTEAAE
ncbi:hypothetical protein BJ165DRAFT_1497187 [Panaeolus papilionaceus]|nr:hypothetical protein BJ165DRAFT_1497187 [Panaeolus papilionaceus]